jgi:hypothetical protein
MKKKNDQKRKITDEEVVDILRNRLKKDPEYYINLLRKLIDEIPFEISDDILFDVLKPTFTQKPSLENIFSGEEHQITSDDSLIVSSESVDMLFHPAVRNKLKDWQQNYFDKQSTEKDKEQVKQKFKKVCRSLTYKGSGRPSKLTAKDKRNIRADFRNVDEKCREIFRKAKYSEANKKKYVREKFPDVAEEVISNGRAIKNPEKLRNAILSKRNKCSLRAVEDCIAEFNLIESMELLNKTGSRTLTIRGSGKKAKISR